MYNGKDKKELRRYYQNPHKSLKRLTGCGMIINYPLPDHEIDKIINEYLES